jgi:hypothetical protein
VALPSRHRGSVPAPTVVSDLVFSAGTISRSVSVFVFLADTVFRSGCWYSVGGWRSILSVSVFVGAAFFGSGSVGFLVGLFFGFFWLCFGGRYGGFFCVMVVASPETEVVTWRQLSW